MIPIARLALACVIAAAAASSPAAAQDQPGAGSPRIALVIGIGAYKTSPLPTAANDAGLVAETLAAAGFDVTGARDLDGASLRRAVHDFLDKASAGGPRGVALVYLAGHALQAEGENYFAPADADLARASDAAIDDLRISDLTHALAATTLGAKIVVVDGAHAEARAAGPLGAGLALVDAEPGTLLAFNAAPGTLAPIEPGPYGLYARTLAETLKQGGVPVDEMFDRLRVAVNSATGGSALPWNVSKLLQPFTFFDRAANAPALGSAQVPFASLRARPLRDFSPEQAYDVALARDTLPAYQDYLTAFPDHPLARRIRSILAVRREAAFWRDALRSNTPPAYWTYLRRYPSGPHGSEARRRLGRLAAAKAPPPGFAPLVFDVPPPDEDERVVFDEHGFVIDADLPPPPPPPLFLLPPPAPDAERLRAPPAAPAPRLLPLPPAAAIPFVRPILAPGAILPPRGVKGDYRQARPFAAGPAEGGLVPRPAPSQDGGEAPPPAAPEAPARQAPALRVPPSPAAVLAAPVAEPLAPRPPAPPKAPTAPVVPQPMPPSPPEAPARPPGGDAHALPKPNAPPSPAPAPAPPVVKADGVRKPKGRPAAAAPAPEAPHAAPAASNPQPAPQQPRAAPPAPPIAPKPQSAPQQLHTAPPAPKPPAPEAPHPHPAPAAKPAAPKPQPTPPAAAPRPQQHPPQGGAKPEGAGPPHPGGDARGPECGHPGQPPCHR